MIGHRVWSLGLLAPVQRPLRSVAAPYMQDVLFATRHVVNLFALEGTRAALLERMAGTAVDRPVARVGERMYLHTSAGGKVLLAYSDGGLFERVIADLPRETRHSITEPGRLHAELVAVRENGFATSSEEHALGTSGLAVPVADAGGRIIAALGIVIIGTPRDSERVVPALQVAAAGISRELAPARPTRPPGPKRAAPRCATTRTPDPVARP
ncbi:IclR family transcriptional regulator [Micrococcales bacterium 31B]|nr:IclR family transcriptional regulator [Micrococcales bacterium 31B]